MHSTRLLKKQAVSEIEQIVTSDSNASRGQINVMQNSLQNLANEGRQILKVIDDYKFKLIQSSNIFKDDKTKLKLEQKQKILASAASLIYSIVFDMENMDLTPLYEEEQFSTLDMDAKSDEVNNEFDNESEEELPEEESEEESVEEPAEEEESDEEEFGEDEDFKMQGGFDEDFDMEEETEEGEEK